MTIDVPDSDPLGGEIFESKYINPFIAEFPMNLLLSSLTYLLCFLIDIKFFI